MFLIDRELIQQLALGPDLIKGIERSSDGAKDAIQPCSVDLRVGTIYVPSAGDLQPGAAEDARIEHRLGTGQTAVVETKETLNFPKDIGAIGFPPASVSSAGLLMTNPGHVDPGYRGRMSFTVINMGRTPYLLRQGNVIATLLLFRLPSEVAEGYAERTSGASGISEEERRKSLLTHLAPDFVNVADRADAAAGAAEARMRAHVASEERRTRLFSFLAPVGATIVAIIVTIVGGILATNAATDDKIEDLDKKIALLERDLGERRAGKTLERRLADLETRVNKLKK